MLKTSCAPYFVWNGWTRAFPLPLVSEDGIWSSSLMAPAFAGLVGKPEQDHREGRDQPVKTPAAGRRYSAGRMDS